MILVTGATGKVGSQVVAQLRERDEAVRAAARNPDAAEFPPGVETRALDLSDPAAFETALEGVDAVFLVFPFPDPDEADRLAPELARRIADRGARVTYLSAQAVEDREDGFWHRVERAIEASGAPWTMLRPTGFAGNAFVWKDQIRAGDTVRWPFADAARSLIDERDIAAVAVRALTEPELEGARPVLTGPETITQREQVEAIGHAIGRPLRFRETDADEAREVLRSVFGASPMVESSLRTWAGFVEHPEKVTDTVRDITGAPARPFAEWARWRAADFA